MKKIILRGILVLVFVLIAALAVGYFSLGSIVKKGVETVGPRLTQVDVRLDGVTLSPLTGNGQLSGLFVGNPPGYKSPSAIKVGEVKLGLKTATVLSDTVEIDELTIESPEITFEGGLTGNNLSKILDNLQAASGGSSSTNAETKSSKKFLVKDLVVRSGTIHLGLTALGEKQMNVPLAEIRLQNIGTGGSGVSAAELGKQIMAPLIATAIKTVATNLPALSQGAKELTGRVRDISNSATQEVGNAVRRLNGLIPKK